MDRDRENRCLEVADGDARKGDVAVLCPVAVFDKTARDVEPERVVFGREDCVQREQLPDDVSDVQQLGDEEQHEQIVGDPAQVKTRRYFYYYVRKHIY